MRVRLKSLLSLVALSTVMTGYLLLLRAQESADSKRWARGDAEGVFPGPANGRELPNYVDWPQRQAPNGMTDDKGGQQNEERVPADSPFVERRPRFPARNPFTLNSNRKMSASINLTDNWTKELRQLDQESSDIGLLFPLHLGTFDQEAYLSPQRMNQKDGVDQMKRFQFNQYASDHTDMDRPLIDFRNSRCRDHSIPDNLPETSVIICFHNEARSALLRTIVSVLTRSPPDLLRDIVLIDDYSDDADDGRLLDSIPKVRVFRMEERQGLIRARIAGAKAAEGEVLTFLDSHCEVTAGWLQPLLSRIRQGTNRIVSPLIDIVDKQTMKYIAANPLIRGGFGHNLHFKWDSLPQDKVLKHRLDPSLPIRTPAIAGGLFAVDRAYFERIGLYDDQMDIWGGENVEISMRVWMCGGVLEIIPCSRVGHIFRSSMPYGFGPGRTYTNTVTKNLRRTVEIWMDEYKEVFYRAQPHARDVEYGDISERLALKDKLHCKPFSWFLKNVYPEFDPPAVQDITYGQLKWKGMCLQGKGQPHHDQRQLLELAACEKLVSGNSKQAWFLASDERIKALSSCLTREKFGNKVFLSPCKVREDTNQIFKWTKTTFYTSIIHRDSDLCLAFNETLVLSDCRSLQVADHWVFRE